MHDTSPGGPGVYHRICHTISTFSRSAGRSLPLLIGALSWKQITFKAIGGQISWSIFGFIAGMFIVVRAVEDTNLTTQFGLLLLHLSGGSSLGSVLIGTLGAAIGTNLVNNVP